MIVVERLRQLLMYDMETGIFTWKEKRQRAGCTAPTGYVIVGVDGKLYLAHRLAWLFVTGNWPNGCIDHKNRNRGDNRWANLREATYPQNIANSPARTTNKAGMKGVSLCRATNKWRATITVDGKQRSLGRHHTKEAASQAYAKAAQEIFGSFAFAETRSDHTNPALVDQSTGEILEHV